MAADAEIITANGKALSSLAGYERRAGNLEPAMLAARDALYARADRQFATGAGWKPSKKAKGRTGIKSGALRASFTTPGAGGIARPGRAELELGSSLFYARWFTGGRPHQPRRPVLRASDPRIRRPLRAAIINWLMDGDA